MYPSTFSKGAGHANLGQLPLWVWIVAIVVIVAVTGVIIWARRRRLHVTGFEVTVGPVKTKLDTEKPAPAPPSVESPSVNISGVKMLGKRNKIAVRRDGTNISDSTLVGEDHEIEVGAKPGPKPKAKKGTQSK